MTTANRLWLLDPDAAAQFPNEDDLTVLVAGAHRSRLAEFRDDLEGAYIEMLRGLPDAPDLSDAERVSKVIGKLEMPNVIRPASGRRIAFVGDAAMATDPLFGVGLTFAFQSAEWLVDETQPALRDGRDLDAALRLYRRKFVWRLGPHHLQIVDYATGRRTRPMERLAFRVATVDPVVALAIGEVVARERSPLRAFDPRIIARLVIPRPRQIRHTPKPARPPPARTVKEPA
jgi:2-polyprenyl-6-methoxyphenol hydroxylase-like FAD-dependent oxidoreductase